MKTNAAHDTPHECVLQPGDWLMTGQPSGKEMGRISGFLPQKLVFRLARLNVQLNQNRGTPLNDGYIQISRFVGVVPARSRSKTGGSKTAARNRV
jgi:hypothetical protein